MTAQIVKAWVSEEDIGSQPSKPFAFNHRSYSIRIPTPPSWIWGFGFRVDNTKETNIRFLDIELFDCNMVRCNRYGGPLTSGIFYPVGLPLVNRSETAQYTLSFKLAGWGKTTVGIYIIGYQEHPNEWCYPQEAMDIMLKYGINDAR